MNGIAGVLMPIYSIMGEILGFQIRNRVSISTSMGTTFKKNKSFGGGLSFTINPPNGAITCD
jgi:hypothetical protein